MEGVTRGSNFLPSFISSNKGNQWWNEAQNSLFKFMGVPLMPKNHWSYTTIWIMVEFKYVEKNHWSYKTIWIMVEFKYVEVVRKAK